MEKNKNKEILLLILKIYGDCPVTALMKLAYLTDISNYYKNGKKISGFNYIRYYYGPFTKEIYKLTDELLKEKKIKVTTALEGYNEVVLFSNVSDKINIEHLRSKEVKLISDVAMTLKGYGAKALKKISYETKPMKMLGATEGGEENLGVILDFKAMEDEKNKTA